MVAVMLPRLTLSDPERDLVELLLSELQGHQQANRTKTAYYEGENRLRDLGISIPPELRDVETVVGWPATVVDVYEERLDLFGWFSSTSDDFGLREAWDANQLASESSMGHIDALLYGVAFTTVGTGDVSAGEPEVLVTVESPVSMTVQWSPRARRVTAALAVNESGAEVESLTLYLPDETIRLERRMDVASARPAYTVVDRDEHRLGRVLVARIVNRPWGAHRQGRSEVTRMVRAITDNAVRTLLGAEVAREFFAAPQRWVMGADESSFVDKDGEPVPAWEAYLGRVLALSPDENGVNPQVGQFAASSPEPFWASIRGLARLLSAEAGIAVTYLGESTDNPASADSIRAMDGRTIKRSERRQVQFGAGWLDTAEHVLLARDGVVPADFRRRISCRWSDPATPTRSAAADEALKLVSANILPPDSKVTYDRLGVSPQQQDQLRTDAARTQQLALAAGFLADPTAADANGA